MTDETHPAGDDLVNRLRSDTPNMAIGHAAMRHAADRIEQLEAALTRANAATAAVIEAAAKAINDRGAAEQKDFGLDRATQNFFRARDIVRALATPDQTAALDRLIAEAVKPYVDALLKRWQGLGCPNCNGDCSHANPPIYSCIMRETHAAILAASKKGGA